MQLCILLKEQLNVFLHQLIHLIILCVRVKYNYRKMDNLRDYSAYKSIKVVLLKVNSSRNFIFYILYQNMLE